MEGQCNVSKDRIWKFVHCVLKRSFSCGFIKLLWNDFCLSNTPFCFVFTSLMTWKVAALLSCSHTFWTPLLRHFKETRVQFKLARKSCIFSLALPEKKNILETTLRNFGNWLLHISHPLSYNVPVLKSISCQMEKGCEDYKFAIRRRGGNLWWQFLSRLNRFNSLLLAWAWGTGQNLTENCVRRELTEHGLDETWKSN